MIEVFPVSIADCEGEADGLVKGVFPDGFVVLAQEGRKDVEAVLRCVGGKLGPGDRGAGSHQVGETDGLARTAARLDSSWPARDHGNAVPAFPVVPLHPTPGPCTIVLELVAHVNHGPNLGAVVAGNDHKGVLREVEFLELFKKFPDDVVELEDKVPVRTGLGFSLEVPPGKGRQVNGLEGMKEKEGLFRGFLRVGVEELQAFFQEDHVDFFKVKVRGHQSGAAVKGPLVFRKIALVDLPGWRDRNPVALHVSIKPVGGGTADRAEKVVEATVDGAIGNWAAVVDPADGLESVPVDSLSLLVEEGHPDVPFAEEGGGVALLLQHGREGEALLFDEAGPADTCEDAAVIQPEGHTPGHDAVAGGSTDRGWAVGVGKEESFAGQAVEVRSLHLALRIVTAYVSVTQVIGKNEEDVGLVPGRQPLGESEKGKEGKKSHEVLVRNEEDPGQAAFLP